MRTASFLILILSLTVAPLPVYGQVYRWIGADGKVQYSDAPPANATEVRKIKSAPPSVEGGAASRNLAEKELAFKKRRLDAAAAAAKVEKGQAETGERRKNCEQSRSQLRMLESGERIADINGKGERIFLDDAARAVKTSDARKAVSEWCQ